MRQSDPQAFALQLSCCLHNLKPSTVMSTLLLRAYPSDLCLQTLCNAGRARAQYRPPVRVVLGSSALLFLPSSTNPHQIASPGDWRAGMCCMLLWFIGRYSRLLLPSSSAPCPLCSRASVPTLRILLFSLLTGSRLHPYPLLSTNPGHWRTRATHR